MVNKRGFLRVLEAIIAVVLLFGVVLFVLSSGTELESDVPQNIVESQNVILKQISLNATLINCILNYDDGMGNLEGDCSNHADSDCKNDIQNLITGSRPVGYNSCCEICGTSLSCACSNLPKDTSVYTAPNFFAGDGTNEKVIRLYFYK